MTEQTPENPNDLTPPTPPVPPAADAEGAAPEQAGSHELPGAASQASFEPTPAFQPAPAYTPEPAAEPEQVAAPEQADAAPAQPTDPALGGHGLPTANPAAPVAPTYGAPEQPQAPYGAPDQQAPYGAPAQPQAPYGAPEQQAPYGAAPQDPYAAAPQNPYGAQAPYTGDPAAPTAPYAGAPGGYPQADPNAAAPYGAAAYGDPSQSGGFPPAGQPGQPGQPGEPEKKKLSTGALIAIIGGALAVVLIIAAVIIIPLANRGGGSPTGDDDEAEAPTASTPAEFVEGYLTAVADGDAKAALEYVDISYYSKELLTDEVLEASLELGAIDDIKTGKVTKNEYENSVVPVTFTVGGEEVEREFEVSESYDGDLSMYDGLIRVSPYGFEEMGLTVNGAEVPDDAAVFPGTYEFAVSVENFGIDGESVFTLIDDDDADAMYNLSPALTEEGVATFRTMVDASLRECLALKSLTTPCGMDIAANDGKGVTSIDGTVTRTLTAEGESALKTMETRITENTVVSGSSYLSMDITFEGEKDGQRGMYEVLFGTGMKTPKVDFAADEPVVVWE